MTPLTEQKRAQFLAFIDQVLKPETAVIGIVGIGSIATGHIRPDSDVDAVIFLDPLDLYIVPAEAIWRASDDTFHSIFNDDPALHAEGLPVDFLRLPWQQWADAAFEWPEERKAELSMGWIAYDPSGKVTQLIEQKTTYFEELRLKRLDEALIWLDQHLGEWSDPQEIWQQLGPAIAHDRLQAAYSYLVQALFAFNRRWQVWRNREMNALLNLPWLPANFAERVLVAANSPSLDYEGYQTRHTMLNELFKELLDKLIDNGDYSPMPIDQAFIRQNEEPGRAWNMEEWNKFRMARKL